MMSLKQKPTMIMCCIILLHTTKHIQEAVNKTYHNIGFATQNIEIKRHIIKTRQGSSNITNCYDTLKGLLTKLDLYQKVRNEVCCQHEEVERCVGDGVSLSIFGGT